MNIKTVGLIAGNGRFPLLFAQAARAQGYQVVACGIEKEADPILSKMTDQFEWVKIGELKKMVKFFLAHGVHEAVMAGKVEKVRLLQENVRPDLDMLGVLMKLKDHKDDSLLGGIADYLHHQGIDLMDSTWLMESYLPGPGPLGKRKCSKEDLENVNFGFKIAKHIASEDIGQTVVVKNKTVVAVESVEGTDQAILRGGQLGGGDVVVIKVAKPKQDMRFDVPAAGLTTLESLMTAKAKVFAFEAGKTLFFDLDLFLERANKAGIALIGIDPNRVL
jgi:hypothetical protein